MDSEECRKALLTRVRKVTPWNAEAIVCHIFTVLSLDKIRQYVDGSDAGIHTLIGKMEKTLMPRAPSPGCEFPSPFWNSGQSRDTFDGIQAPSAVQIGASQLPVSSSIPDDGMRDFTAPSLNSQCQSSSTSEGIQAPSAGQIGASQLPVSSINPDDGMCDFPAPSLNSQGQSSSTSAGIQAPTAGQIVTSQIPDDKLTGLKEHSQSSSVPGCSNVTGCLPSSSRPWPEACHFYMFRRGFCKKGLSCEFSHGFGPSGKLEMEIRQLLLGISCPAVFVEDLTWIYLDWYKKHLPVESIWDPLSLPSLLRSLHTICWVLGSYERHFVVLLEHYQEYMGYSADLRYREVLKDEGPNQIYIGLLQADRSAQKKMFITISASTGLSCL